jgi:predicted transcriptional regulator of viral defense system
MLGVIAAPFPKVAPDQLLRVTGLERTLTDIAVRPVYSGGPEQIIRACYGTSETAT